MSEQKNSLETENEALKSQTLSMQNKMKLDFGSERESGEIAN